MKRYLYNYRQLNVLRSIKILLFCGLFFFIYACNTTGTKDYSAMSNNKLLEKGDEAPGFIANTYNDNSISLTKLQKVGPVVLIFIRGFS